MERHTAYRILAGILEEFRARSYDELLELVGGKPIHETKYIDDECVDIDIEVYNRNGVLRVVATANGPSHWGLDRFEESIAITCPEPR